MIKINHVAIVAADLEESLTFWRDALGLALGGTEHVAAESVDVAFLPVGESQIELLAPTDDKSGVAKYLEKRGPGLHHICFEVDDIEDTLAQLRAHQIRLINEEARTREDGTRYAFVHPKATGGVLVELYEKPGADS